MNDFKVLDVMCELKGFCQFFLRKGQIMSCMPRMGDNFKYKFPFPLKKDYRHYRTFLCMLMFCFKS